MMTAIDMHAHYYGGLVDDLMRRETRPFVSRNERGRLVLNAMTASTEMSDGYTDLAARLAWMDERRIATQLLTFPGALGVDVMPAAEVAGPIAPSTITSPASAAIQAGASRASPPAARRHGAGRGRDAAHQARLKLPGVILPGNYFLSIAAAKLLTPVFEAANAEGALLMIHPGLMPGEVAARALRDTPVYRASVLNLQATLAQMGMTVLSPPLRGLSAHHLPARQSRRHDPLRAGAAGGRRLSRPPHAPFPRASRSAAWSMTAPPSPRALELAVRTFGADRVMMGTDYPIFAPDQVRDTVEAAELSEADKAMVLSGTAARVLERLGA